MGRKSQIVIILLMILFGLPEAAEFYPPLFAGIADDIPLDFIFRWMRIVGTLIIVFGLGRVSSRYGYWIAFIVGHIHYLLNLLSVISTPVENSGTIEGCIQTNGTIWKGTAEFNNGRVTTAEVEYKAYCPQCQAILYDGTNKMGTVLTPGPDYWTCPDCGHRTTDEYSKYESAENLFQTEVGRIVESDGESYSIGSLLEQIEGEPSPRAIWEAYAEVVDKPHVTTDCFY